jgi:1-phosphatidylinositol-3-phosphate 5-kinase
MVNHKPLPEIPPPDINLTTLSVDARTHRSRLLSHFLSEIHEFGIETKRDVWVGVFEDVLDEMGTCLNEGRWLAEFRKTKEGRRERRRAEREAKMQHEAVKPKKLVKSQSAGSGTGTGASEATHEHKLSSTNSSDESRTTTSGSTKLVAKPTLVQAPEEKRLLLCVAPLGSRPTEDSGFALVNHDIPVGCTFVPGLFTFPGATVLYGNSEWTSKLLPQSYPTKLTISIQTHPTFLVVHSPFTT